MGADGANRAGQGEVHALAGDRGFFGAGFDGRAARFDLRFDVRAQFV